MDAALLAWTFYQFCEIKKSDNLNNLCFNYMKAQALNLLFS